MSELYDILTETPPTKVVLLALDQGLWDCERSLAELSALCEANHMEAVAQITQKRQTPETGIVLGSGKLEEASLAAETLDAECAVFDGELTGSQIRNISNALGGLEVIDRTMLILEIFRSRAVTNEGKLQTELALLRKLRKLPGVKKVFVRSGIRFDYTMADASDEFLRELLEHHVSGQLRVAPEHVSDAVLSVMGKPSRAVYDAFCRKFERLNREYGLKQYVVPYLISSHPGSTMKEAVDLAEAVRDMGYMPEQVQDFYPTPGTLSTCMYYTGIDPRDMTPVFAETTPHGKELQRALLQWFRPDKKKLVIEALKKAGREDLIGYGPKCLVRPRRQPKQVKKV